MILLSLKIPRQKNPTLPLRSRHIERKTKVHMAYSRAHMSQVITCLSYGTSLLAMTVVNNNAVP